MSGIVDKGLVQRGLSAHAALGLLASALLYVVCLTGTVAVFRDEMQRVEQPRAPEMTAITPAAMQRGIAEVLASETGKTPTTHLYVRLPTDAVPRATITTDTQAFHLDREGRIAKPEEIAFTDFLIALHYSLNLPSLIGMSIVGILGVMMMALSLTGVIAHPRIFRDAFRLRARDGGGVGLADWHNRIGVWTLPFSIAIALTGSLIGLASLTAYGVATAYYKGDLTAVYAPIFGGEGKPDAKAAPIPDVVTPMRVMAERFPEAKPYYVVLHDPQTKGQHVQIIAEHERRLIFGEYYSFSADGRFLGKAGLSDGAAGQQMAASTYNLHFGNYGGLPVKLAYFLFGAALCGTIATGTDIWLGKRERRGFHHPRLRNGWNGVVWGMPLALTATFIARIVFGNGAPLAAIFWTLWAVILLVSIALPPRRIRMGRVLLGLLGLGLLGTGVSAALASLV